MLSATACQRLIAAVDRCVLACDAMSTAPGRVTPWLLVGASQDPRRHAPLAIEKLT